MVEGLKVVTDKAAAAEQIKALYRLFVEKVGVWAGRAWCLLARCVCGGEGVRATSCGAFARAAPKQANHPRSHLSQQDCTMVEVIPLAETAEALVAADAKLGFDDNAAFRQKDLFAMRDESQEDPRWV